MEFLNDLMSVQVDLGTSMMVFATVLGVLYAGWMVVKKVTSAVVGLLGRFPGTVLIPASIVAGAGMVGWGCDELRSEPVDNSTRAISTNELLLLSRWPEQGTEATERVKDILKFAEQRETLQAHRSSLGLKTPVEIRTAERKTSGGSFITSGIGLILCGVFGGIRRFCWPTFFEYEPEDGSEDA